MSPKLEGSENTSRIAFSSLALPLAAKAVVQRINRLIAQGQGRHALGLLPGLDAFRLHNAAMVDLTKGTFLIDIGNQLDNAEHVRQGISLIQGTDVGTLPMPHKAQWYYNVGNGYSTLFRLKRITSGFLRPQDPDYRHAKDVYRKAMESNGLPSETEARLCTNYGNMLRKVGRHVEEIEAYDRALKCVPGHAMALLNKARGLCWYSRLTERPTKRTTLIEARGLLMKSLEAGLEEVPRKLAETELHKLEKIVRHAKQGTHRPTKHIAHSDVEQSYISFCLKNRLYLHPCPHESHQAYLDPLSVSFPTSKMDEHHVRLEKGLGSLKHEYVVTRFLLFCSQSKVPDLGFVDRGTFLPMRSQGQGDVYWQLLNFSFRCAYALLDKIAFFLNGYCDLQIREKQVYFHKDAFLTKENDLRRQLKPYDGMQLAALVDLCLDFTEPPGPPLKWLKELRNKLEHRCVILGEPCNTVKSDIQQAGHAPCPEVLYELPEEELYRAALQLLKTARAAIFYLFAFVRGFEKISTSQLKDEIPPGRLGPP